MLFIPDCHISIAVYFFTTLDEYCLFLIVTWTSLFLFFTTLDGCCLFLLSPGHRCLFFCNTLSNARDMLIANVSQCIVRRHHCPAANIRNLAATPIPPSPSCAVHHGPCPKATPHPPAAHQCQKVYQIGAKPKTWREHAFGGSNCKKLTTFNGVSLSGTERLSNEAQNVFTCGAGGIAGDDGASCKGNEVGIPFQIC